MMRHGSPNPPNATAVGVERNVYSSDRDPEGPITHRLPPEHAPSGRDDDSSHPAPSSPGGRRRVVFRRGRANIPYPRRESPSAQIAPINTAAMSASGTPSFWWI